MKSKKLKPNKKKMKAVKGKMVMVGRQDGTLFATEALCRHMRWPLAYGATIKDGCVRCPLHQTTHQLDDGSLVEWSPFPLFLLRSFGRRHVKEEGFENLRSLEHEGYIQVRFEPSTPVPVGSLTDASILASNFKNHETSIETLEVMHAGIAGDQDGEHMDRHHHRAGWVHAGCSPHGSCGFRPCYHDHAVVSSLV